MNAIDTARCLIAIDLDRDIRRHMRGTPARLEAERAAQDFALAAERQAERNYFGRLRTSLRSEADVASFRRELRSRQR
jgi:hypothetical protein